MNNSSSAGPEELFVSVAEVMSEFNGAGSMFDDDLPANVTQISMSAFSPVR